MDVPFLGRVPLDPEMVLQCDRGEPYALFHSDLPTADAIHGIANKIEEFCKKKGGKKGSLVNVAARPAPFKKP